MEGLDEIRQLYIYIYIGKKYNDDVMSFQREKTTKFTFYKQLKYNY